MLLFLVSHTLALLNRAYAHYSFIVNYTLYAFLWIFLHGPRPNRDATVNRTKGWAPGVFVTCSEGPVGRAVVLRLAEEGYTVHAGVSSEEQGEKMVRQSRNLGLRNGGMIRPIVYDNEDLLSIKRAADSIETYDEKHPNRGLVAVVCEPGSLTISPFRHLDDKQIDVSCSFPIFFTGLIILHR